MTGFLLQEAQDGGRYLERVPYDDSYGFHAALQTHATVFSYDAAVLMQRQRTEATRLVRDYYNRPPQVMAADVPQDAA